MQNLEFSATSGLALSAVARAIGAYTLGTAANSVNGQAGTDRYLATFNANLPDGTYRLDYSLAGVPFGSEIFDVSGDGTFQPRSEAAAAGGGSTNVVVIPLQASQTLRVDGSNIRAKVRETSLVGMSVDPDEFGEPVVLDGMSLEVRIESLDKLVTHVIDNSDISRSESSFSFKLPAAVTLVPREWSWSLRETVDEGHLCGGSLTVTYAP